MEQDELDSSLFREMSLRRKLRAAMYLSLVGSGIFALIDPSSIVTEQASPLVAVLWAMGMLGSAAICLYSPITDKWIGEFTGIPLLASVLALYGGSAILEVEKQGFIILGYGLVMVAFSLGLVARWVDVLRIKQNATGGTREKEAK